MIIAGLAGLATLIVTGSAAVAVGAAVAGVAATLAVSLFSNGAFDSIMTDWIYQIAIWLQALVRMFCVQFVTAFIDFSSSITDILSMFGLSDGAEKISDLNWLNFEQDGSVLNVFAVFVIVGIFVAIVVFVINLFRVALAPVIEAKEKPTTLIARFVIAMILILYSPSIVCVVSYSTQSINSLAARLSLEYSNDTQNQSTEKAEKLAKKVLKYDQIEKLYSTSTTTDYDTAEGAPDMNTFQRVCAAVTEVVCSIVICVEFLKLLAECCMRVMVLFMEYLIFPAMAGTLVSRETEGIFRAYLQALFVQAILVDISMVWYSLFMGICTNIDFSKWGIVAGLMFEIGFLQMARNFDNYLAKFGVSNVGVASNLFDSIVGSMNTVANTARAVGRSAASIGQKKGLIGKAAGAARDKSLGLERDGKGGIDISSMTADNIAKMANKNGKTPSEAKAQKEALKKMMQDPKAFNAMKPDQRAAAVAAHLGGENKLKNALDTAGIKTDNMQAMSFKLNPDGSLSVSGATFKSGNTGSFAISPNGMVTPGKAATIDVTDGVQIGAEGRIRPGDNPIKAMPQTDAEAYALTGHSLNELKNSPALAASFAGDGTTDFMNKVLDGKGQNGSSAREQMSKADINMADGMHMGKDGLVHGKADLGGLGESGVVIGSKDELAKAGYENIAAFDTENGQLGVAIDKQAQLGTLSSEGITSDSVAQMMGAKDAATFNNDAVNHQEMFASNKAYADAVAASLTGEGSRGNFASFAGTGENDNMKVSADAKGGLHAKASNGVEYDLKPTGKTYATAEERSAAVSGNSHAFVDAAGNGYEIAISDSGLAHGGVGDYSMSGDDTSGSEAAKDAFAWNTGSSVDDIKSGFGGKAQGDDRAYVDDIAGVSIHENGMQTAYDNDGNCVGARVADKANSSRGNTNYIYDAASSAGCTDQAKASQMFGEDVETSDNGATWKTAGGTQYMRMHAASSTGFDPSRSTASAKTGVDDAGRPYTYVKMEKNKGFDKGKVSNGKRSQRRNNKGKPKNSLGEKQ